MDLKAYIESGILEQYVSGLLSEKENQEIDRLASVHPEIKLEIDSIRASINELAISTGNNVDTSILSAALDSIEMMEEEPIKDSTPDKIVAITSSAPWFRIAASFLLLISVSLNVYFFITVNDVRQNQANAMDEISNLYEQMDFVTSEANLRVPLQGLEISPSSHATVYINRQTRDVYIKIGDLPAPPSGHQYQLWADRDGHMHNIGVFHHNNQIQHLAIFEGDFESLNVTLEEEGGSENATVERAYLSGRI